MTEPRFVVFTGMHRSHTSLLGSLFERAGLRFHADVIGATSSNPHGHFEDTPILRVHEATLEDNGARWFRGIDRPLTVSEARHADLARLITRRFDELGPVWGFKTPHSALFLDTLAEFPEARFVFIHRDPQAVLSSLLRRMGRQLYRRPDAPLRFARAYAIYNERIADFTQAHPERCHVISSDALIADPEGVLGTVSDRFGLGLTRVGAATSLVRPETVSAPGHMLERILAHSLAALPRVQRAHARMQALTSALPGADG